MNRKRMPRRHEAEVTADRLGNAAMKWAAKFSSRELDDIGFIIHALHQIAEGER